MFWRSGVLTLAGLCAAGSSEPPDPQVEVDLLEGDDKKKKKEKKEAKKMVGPIEIVSWEGI